MDRARKAALLIHISLMQDQAKELIIPDSLGYQLTILL